MTRNIRNCHFFYEVAFSFAQNRNRWEFVFEESDKPMDHTQWAELIVGAVFAARLLLIGYVAVRSAGQRIAKQRA